MSGGNNTNAKQTLLVLLASWILEVCWQYSRDGFNITIEALHRHVASVATVTMPAMTPGK